ncbi:hypothetical protein B0H13DRAFT_2381848 [Mycena leptocephala]|nr:hypothetical protein B0H13DRAFT_2381848 [Mycena leptocephala]
MLLQVLVLLPSCYSVPSGPSINSVGCVIPPSLLQSTCSVLLPSTEPKSLYADLRRFLPALDACQNNQVAKYLRVRGLENFAGRVSIAGGSMEGSKKRRQQHPGALFDHIPGRRWQPASIFIPLPMNVVRFPRITAGLCRLGYKICHQPACSSYSPHALFLTPFPHHPVNTHPSPMDTFTSLDLSTMAANTIATDAEALPTVALEISERGSARWFCVVA